MSKSKHTTVRTQMPKSSTSSHGVGGGLYDQNKGPFDAKHDTGNGGIPLKFFESNMGGKSASTITPTQTGRGLVGPSRSGQQQFPKGRNKAT